MPKWASFFMEGMDDWLIDMFLRIHKHDTAVINMIAQETNYSRGGNWSV
jgi:hypothetical protein